MIVAMDNDDRKPRPRKKPGEPLSDPPTAPKAAPQPQPPGADAASAPVPALKRAGTAPGAGRPDGADAAFAVNRLTALAHELSNLLDGSMRCLKQAQGSVERSPAAVGGQVRDSRPTNPSSNGFAQGGGDVLRRLDTVYKAMEQMAGLVRSTMAALSAGACIGPRHGLVEDWSLSDAIEHAADVMRPVAEDQGIAIEVSVDGRLTSLSAGSIYAVLTAGVRNAIEAVKGTARKAGQVRIEARLEEPAAKNGVSASTKWVRIDIVDDGIGPPSLPPGQEKRVMEFGFSTKMTGLGIGLAMARDIVADLGGTLELRRRPADNGLLPGRGPGAVLRVRYPVPARRGGV